ncbi:MAG: hypothetical protein C5B54_04660, partial [Acidobacteria bacterium]
MKVAQIIDSLKIGGAQKLQVTFAQAAKSRDLEILVVALQERETNTVARELANLGAKVITLHADKLLDRDRLDCLQQLLRDERVDVVQTHLTAANIAGLFAAWRTAIPAVATLHTAGIDRRYNGPIRRFSESLMLRLAASQIVAVGKVVADANRVRLFAKRVHVIHNAVDFPPPILYEERRALRAEIMDDASRPLLLSVGRIAPPKGYPDLINAISILRMRHPDIAL